MVFWSLKGGGSGLWWDGGGGERGEGAAGFGVHSPAATDHEKFPGFPHNFYHGK